jgi:serine/threonine-protein kinase
MVSEILTLEDGSAGEWLRNASAGKVQELVDQLVARGFVTVTWDPATGTVIGDAQQEKIYTVVTDVRRELSSLARGSERERGDLLPPITVVPGAPPQPAASMSPWLDTDSFGTVRGGLYQLIEVIGRGGMGTVYRARDTRLERDVAIKMLESPALISDEKMRARFRREAAIATGVHHPGIVNTFELFEEPDGRMGLVMELLDDQTLDTAVPLSPPKAVALAAELLEAIAYLDKRGFARLDLKPTNIVLRNGRPVIIDLGLVKPSERDLQTVITEVGLLIGTPSYMSPEQVTGLPVDIRSDIFAVGVLLFEMISGSPAFASDSAVGVLHEIVNSAVKVDELPASPELRAVIERATARAVDDRFASPAEMAAALRAAPEASRPIWE